MLSIPLGPLALPTAPVLLLAAVWMGSVLAARVAARGGGASGTTAAAVQGASAGDALWWAAAVGLLAARLAFVARHGDAYAAAPWSIVDLRDGGWHARAGVAAALAWVAWRMLARPALRGGIAAGATLAAALWFGGSFALGRWDRAPVPDVPVIDLATGRTTTLARALDGRPAVVNLWASWCGPCRAEMPLLVAAQQRDTGVAVLLVNQGETEAIVRAYLRRERLDLREVMLDTGRQLSEAAGASGLPTTLFLDAQGRRVDVHVGVLSDAVLRARMAALGAMR